MRLSCCGLALLEGLEDVLEGAATALLRQLSVALARGTTLGDLPGDAVLGDDEEVVAGTGDGGQAEHHDGTGRARLLDGVAVLVEHRADATEGLAGNDRVAGAQRAALDEDGRHRTTTAVEVRLDGDTLGVLVRVGREVERRVGGEQDRLEQLVDVGAGACGHVDEHRVAAVLLGDQAVLGELAAHLGRVGAFLVDLVDRHHDRHVGRLGVVERLDRLRLHAVVGRDHQDRDVGDLGTTSTHGRERLVTRGVDEGDLALEAFVLRAHLVGTDVLGDAAGLAA